mgnify:CR=1 FL=1
MRENLNIKTEDGKKIYGVLDYQAKTRKLIIFVHGFRDNKSVHLLFNAPSFFNAKGFTTYRFDLYSSKRAGRILDECNLDTHARDLNQVIKHFQDDYDEIFLIGISLGGPVILRSNLEQIKKIVLWDGSVKRNPESEKGKLLWSEEFNCYVSRSGVRCLIGKEMVDDWENIDYDEWIKNCQVPTKVISAGNGLLVSTWNKLADTLPFVKEYTVIEGATHCFDEEGAEQKVHSETFEFLK